MRSVVHVVVVVIVDHQSWPHANARIQATWTVWLERSEVGRRVGDPGLVRIMGWKSLLYSVVKNTGYVVAGLCSVAVGLLYVFQDKLLYHPVLPGMERSNRHNPRGMKSPREHGIAFEDLRIETEDGLKIHAWLMRPAAGQEARATVLYFHGNAGNIGFRLPNAKQMVEILRVNVLLVEYRGYGDSDDARPNETGFMRDARAALKQMLAREDIDPARIIAFGRSIGGAVALSLAHDSGPGRGGIAAVIVENTFLSIGKMVDTIFPSLVPLKPLVLRLRWNSEAIIDRVEQPILFINGCSRRARPASHSHQLHKQAAATRFKELYIIEQLAQATRGRKEAERIARSWTASFRNASARMRACLRISPRAALSASPSCRARQRGSPHLPYNSGSGKPAVLSV